MTWMCQIDGSQMKRRQVTGMMMVTMVELLDQRFCCLSSWLKELPMMIALETCQHPAVVVMTEKEEERENDVADMVTRVV